MFQCTHALADFEAIFKRIRFSLETIRFLQGYVLGFGLKSPPKGPWQKGALNSSALRPELPSLQKLQKQRTNSIRI